MKIRLVLIVNLFALFLISQFYLAVSSNRIEDRSTYKVVHKGGHFEIRMYNPIAVEAINSQAYRFKEYGKRGIKDLERIGLSDHISFGPQGSQKYTNSLISNNLAANTDANRRSTVAANNTLYLAVITFEGFAFENDIKNYAKTMVLALKKAEIRHFGNFQFVSYNSRFQLFNRRNEVIVHINYK